MPTRDEWVGVKDHPYKTNHILKVSAVPSVLLVIDGKVVMRAANDDTL